MPRPGDFDGVGLGALRQVADVGVGGLDQHRSEYCRFEEIFPMTASTRQRDVVAAAVESLHPEYRQVLVAAYFQGRSATETARVLGLPVHVVKLRIYEALHQIRRILAAEGISLHPTAGRDPVPA
jgi:DNA-directed RNA polymerase specialized sigma24 family protein